MWLENLLLKHRVKKLTGGNVANPFKPNRILCMQLLELLDSSFYDNYKPAIGVRTDIELVSKNLDEYIQRVQDISFKLKNSRPITYEMVPSNRDRVEITLDDFLVTKDSHYYDIQPAVDSFKKHAMTFCNELRKREKQTEVAWEHNLNMVAAVLADTEILARVFVSIAFVKE